MNVTYVMTDIRKNKSPITILRGESKEFFGMAFLSAHEKYGFGSKDMHVVLCYQGAMQDEQLSVNIPDSEMARFIETAALLELRPV